MTLRSYFFISLCVIVTASFIFVVNKAAPANLSQIAALDSVSEDSKLRVTFAGVATLLFDDGETAFMTDGFFSRPGKWDLLWNPLVPNESIVSKALQRLHVSRLEAVIPLHSHYDHALDSSMVTKKTTAVLIGSESTANIGRSYGLPENQIKTVRDGEQIQLGRFKITFLLSAHSPEAFFDGDIGRFQMGDCYSLLIEHEGQTLLVHGSAGYIPGKLANIKADVVYLGIGALGRQSTEFMNSYWDEVIKASQARRIVLIHWDDFFKPSNEPLAPFSWPLDDIQSAADFLTQRAATENVDIRLPEAWKASNPFHELKGPVQ